LARLTEVLDSTTKLLIALTGLIAAVAGIWAAIAHFSSNERPSSPVGGGTRPTPGTSLPGSPATFNCDFGTLTIRAAPTRSAATLQIAIEATLESLRNHTTHVPVNEDIAVRDGDGVSYPLKPSPDWPMGASLGPTNPTLRGTIDRADDDSVHHRGSDLLIDFGDRFYSNEGGPNCPVALKLTTPR
jgi:hypothetical protein